MFICAFNCDLQVTPKDHVEEPQAKQHERFAVSTNQAASEGCIRDGAKDKDTDTDGIARSVSNNKEANNEDTVREYTLGTQLRQCLTRAQMMM